MRRLRRLRMAFALGLLLATASADFVACASKTTTVTRDTENGEDVTVTRETEEVARPTGVLSTTVHVIGEIIALPFRIVAGIITFIF